MGAGIVEVLARAGLSVTAVEINDEALARGRGHVEQSTDRAVSRGKLDPADRDAIFERIRFTHLAGGPRRTPSWSSRPCPSAWSSRPRSSPQLDKICPPDTILATNTSSLSVTEISVATGRPSKVIGMHFFNPAPVMKLVEVVRTVVTEPAVVEDVEALAARLGKVDVTIGDQAGFIANALLFGYLNHAVSMYENRYASREDIDAAMRLGCGLPMGPLALMDLIGLDTAYEILDTMYKQSRNRLHAPSPIIKQMVTAGLLGRKTGRGFYTYARPGSAEVVDDAHDPGRRRRRRGRPAGADRRRRRLRHDGHRHHRGLRQGRLRRRSSSPAAPEKVEAVQKALAKSLEKQVQRGKLEEAARDEVLGRVTGTTSLDELADGDLVIEAVVEALAGQGGAVRQPRRDRQAGRRARHHDLEPAGDRVRQGQRPARRRGRACTSSTRRQVMKLVEVVSTISTAPDVAATAHAVCEKLGKHAVSCADRAGFIVNALLFPYLNDAVKMLEAHYATADDIDAAMKVGCGYPMGPFELLDVVGLDVSLAIQRELYLEFREPGFAPAPLLEHLVTAGYLGRKTGRGFRDYASR